MASRDNLWRKSGSAFAVAVSAALMVGTGNAPAWANPNNNQCQSSQECGGDDFGILGLLMALQWAMDKSDDGKDPWIDVTTIRDKGATMSSATGALGAVNGLSQSSRTTDVGGGADASYSASKYFDLAANQRLVVGGLFRYD